MAKPTVTVSLNKDDFDFISDSISLNVPGDEDKTTEQLRTSRKLERAWWRLVQKSN